MTVTAEVEQKKYKSIERYGKSGNEINVRGNIVIWEKLDGANASFQRVGDKVLAFSHRNFLDGSKDKQLGGFYGWVQENIKAEDLVEGYVYFGEWTNLHKVNYGENLKKFFFFDLYDTEKERYLDMGHIRTEAGHLGLTLAPIFYEGEYVSEDHTQSFVGKSMLAPDGKGEGIVVKNYKNLDRFGNQSFLKIVTKEFQETNGAKVREMIAKPDPLTMFINDTVTEARIEKMLHKLVDEGKLKEDYAIEDMGEILRALGSSVYEDVIKEEADTLAKLVKGRIGRAVPNVVKAVLVNTGRA